MVVVAVGCCCCCCWWLVVGCDDGGCGGGCCMYVCAPVHVRVCVNIATENHGQMLSKSPL